MPKDYNESPVTDPYVRLRTILDSVEVGSIRYYLQYQDSPDRGKHFEKLRSVLMPVIEFVWGSDKEITCPDGYQFCDGVCVPYTCPREIESDF